MKKQKRTNFDTLKIIENKKGIEIVATYNTDLVHKILESFEK